MPDCGLMIEQEGTVPRASICGVFTRKTHRWTKLHKRISITSRPFSMPGGLSIREGECMLRYRWRTVIAAVIAFAFAFACMVVPSDKLVWMAIVGLWLPRRVWPGTRRSR